MEKILSHQVILQTLEALLAAGSRTDVLEKEQGQSPLFCAISHNYAQAVQLLVKYGKEYSDNAPVS